MSLKWERLRLPTDERPPLLFNFTTSSDGYQLYITDLTYMWSERCNRKAILKKADEQNTTIDPSEDPEQFKVLLQKIEGALRGSAGSSISLNRGNGNGRSTEPLEVVVITKLPAPLKPLKWSLYLAKEPNSSSTRHLLLPLLMETAGYESRERALLDQVKHKDWVLGKLFDKVETMGIDLGTVFPGTSGLRAGAGKKGTTLAQAGKYIKGVAPFDEQAFTNETSRAPGLGLAANLVAGVSDSGSAEGVSPAGDKWWDSLPVQGTEPATPRGEVEKRVGGTKPSSQPRDDMEADTDAGQETEGEDEFERQETPPRMKQSEGTEISPPSTGEPKQQEPRRLSPTPSPQKPTGKPSKGIGKVGGNKATKKPSPTPDTETTTPSPEPEKEAELPAPTPSRKEEDLETASESDHPPETAKPKGPNKQKKPGLGVIGGKKKEKQPSPSPSPPPAPASPSEQNSPEAVPPKRTSKLGIIGGKKKQKPPSPSQPAPGPAPAPAPAPSTESTDSEHAVAPGPAHGSGKRPPKLGVIGGRGKSKSKTKAHAESTERREPSPQLSSAASRPGEEEEAEKTEAKAEGEPKREPQAEQEETEQERADRKRGELKRQLEAKSKAPVKKKRKF